MVMRFRVSHAAFLLFASLCVGALPAQKPANSNAYYQQLRGLLPGGEIINVSNLELKRDAAVFTFKVGSFAFYGEVNGKVTGAVFQGQGHLHITPPNAEERHNLKILNQTEEFDEDFDQAVLRFTDGTAQELHKASAGAGQNDTHYGRAAQDLQNLFRHHSILSYTDESGTYYDKVFYGNLDLRLLEDVMSPTPGGFFLAALHTKKSQYFFILDPHGVDEVAPDEVALLSWDSGFEALTYPLAFHRASDYANGASTTGDKQNAAYKIVNEKLDVTIEKNGMLSSVATVEVRANQDGLAVVPLNLYPTLRVSEAQSDKGEALDFVQEGKDLDPDFGVVLAAPLKQGETTSVHITYGGKNVVMNMGNGNYYPIARENWYPSSNQGLGDYATYQMTFHVPKELQLIATGTKTNQTNEGKQTVTEWKTETPLPVVGFSLGDFESKGATVGNSAQGPLSIDAFANKLPPEYLASMSGGVLGSLAATPMLANELSQGQVAMQIYTQYYGQIPFSHVSLTEQSACNYGQSWPMLVYLPVCGFMDVTQQHFLGIGGENLNKHMYWQVVTPHEVAHQWWGQTVGFRGYRDQWMSEGFADASAALFLLRTNPKPDQYLNFWKEEKRTLTEKNQFGFRPIDVGALTMGIRLSSPKAGFNIYGDLVYPKGAFILHMIQMMMWTPADGDKRFIETMHDFVSTYKLEPATTEDFKATLEKHMSPEMNLDRNGRMDWFFNEYVYGTELPAYHFEGQITGDADKASLHFKLTQSGVSAEFKMLVPVYLEFQTGKIIEIGRVPIVGDRTVEQTVSLPKLPPVKSVLINHYYDVLSTEN